MSDYSSADLLVPNAKSVETIAAVSLKTKIINELASRSFNLGILTPKYCSQFATIDNLMGSFMEHHVISVFEDIAPGSLWLPKKGSHPKDGPRDWIWERKNSLIKMNDGVLLSHRWGKQAYPRWILEDTGPDGNTIAFELDIIGTLEGPAIIGEVKSGYISHRPDARRRIVHQVREFFSDPLLHRTLNDLLGPSKPHQSWVFANTELVDLLDEARQNTSQWADFLDKNYEAGNIIVPIGVKKEDFIRVALLAWEIDPMLIERSNNESLREDLKKEGISLLGYRARPQSKYKTLVVSTDLNQRPWGPAPKNPELDSIMKGMEDGPIDLSNVSVRDLRFQDKLSVVLAREVSCQVARQLDLAGAAIFPQEDRFPMSAPIQQTCRRGVLCSLDVDYLERESSDRTEPIYLKRNVNGKRICLTEFDFLARLPDRYIVALTRVFFPYGDPKKARNKRAFIDEWPDIKPVLAQFLPEPLPIEAWYIANSSLIDRVEDPRNGEVHSRFIQCGGRLVQFSLTCDQVSDLLAKYKTYHHAVEEGNLEDHLLRYRKEVALGHRPPTF